MVSKSLSPTDVSVIPPVQGFVPFKPKASSRRPFRRNEDDMVTMSATSYFLHLRECMVPRKAETKRARKTKAMESNNGHTLHFCGKQEKKAEAVKKCTKVRQTPTTGRASKKNITNRELRPRESTDVCRLGPGAVCVATIMARCTRMKRGLGPS